MSETEFLIHARRKIYVGNQYPYDAPDGWREDDDAVPPPPKDWAHSAARGIIADLCDRRGTKQEFRGISEEVRADIVESLAAIIRVSYEERDTPDVERKGNRRPVGMDHDLWVRLGKP
jgi:hypothetical protein